MSDAEPTQDAGLTRPDPAGTHRFSRARCIQALDRAWALCGHSPSRREYEALPIRPTRETIVRRFGSWNNAKRAAGHPEYARVDTASEDADADADVDADADGDGDGNQDGLSVTCPYCGAVVSTLPRHLPECPDS